MMLADLKSRVDAEFERLYRLHIVDDEAFIARLSAIKSADVIDTLLLERLRRVRVDLHRFVLSLTSDD